MSDPNEQRPKTLAEYDDELGDGETTLAEIHALVMKLRPHFAGVHPLVSSAVLADLTASHLAGFVALRPDDSIDQEGTDAHRDVVIESFIKLVRELLDANQRQDL